LPLEGDVLVARPAPEFVYVDSERCCDLIDKQFKPLRAYFGLLNCEPAPSRFLNAADLGHRRFRQRLDGVVGMRRRGVQGGEQVVDYVVGLCGKWVSG
jgi:hypothetical protein